MNDHENRNKIIERIAKMREASETVTSEAEAMVFASKAAQMMEAYSISEAELALAEADGRVVFDIVEQTTEGRRGPKKGWERRSPSQHRANITLSALCALTTTEVVIYGHSAELGFTGHRPDVEMAIFLYSMFRKAMDREYESWKRGQINGVSRTAKGAFHIAMARRIAGRLREHAEKIETERKARAEQDGDTSAPTYTPENESNGPIITARLTDESMSSPALQHEAEVARTALVIVDAKREETRRAFETAHPRLRSSSGFTMSHNGDGAYRAGQVAGGRVGFNRPLGTGGSQSQIGG